MSELLERGFAILPNAIDATLLVAIEEEYRRLETKAKNILQAIANYNGSYSDYYRHSGEALIAVPENKQPETLCRFEYIAGSSPFLKNVLVTPCSQAINAYIKKPITLFKDKINIKSPGGGAFTPHQDAPAYTDFGPSLYFTAAIFLDAATEENGALKMCQEYRHLKHPLIEEISTPLGNYPCFPTDKGGENHGRIRQELEDLMLWTPVCAKPGDIIFFDSYIPHQSAINHSLSSRRAFFLTFNLASDGDHYETYYESKRANFGHPRFHIATPTHYDNDSLVTD